MKKLLSNCKRLLVIFMILSLCNNTCAAVGANDGSAFVTKAEFDALVNTFNEQIDEYESNIITKVDGAIANYIASMQNRTTTTRDIIYKDASTYGVLSINNDNPLDYKYGFPVISGWTMQGFTYEPNGGGASSQNQIFSPCDDDDNFVSKVAITNLYANSSNTSNSTAEFQGYYENGKDYVYCAGFSNTLSQSYVKQAWNKGYWALAGAYQVKDTNLIGSMKQIGYFKDIASTGTGEGNNSGYIVKLFLSAIDHSWGTLRYKYVSVMSPYNYDMFSNYDRDYNWGYDGSYMTQFGGYENKLTLSTRTGNKLNPYYECISNTTSHLMYMNGYNSESNSFYYPSDNTSTMRSNVMYAASSDTVYCPMVGFESKYLTNWKQIYLTNSDNIANNEYTYDSSVKGLLEDSTGGRHLSLGAGFPLIKINGGEILEYNISFKDKSKNYVIWISTKPFDPDTHPDENANCIVLNDVPLAKNCTNGYSIVSGEAKIRTNEIRKDCVLYIKFGIANSDKTKIAGGLLMPESTGTITFES